MRTFNVNGVNGRLSVLQRWLSETSPDVVCLQELKAPQDKFPERAIRDAGYGAVWYGQKSWNGVAILARGTEPTETRRDVPGDPEDGGRPGTFWARRTTSDQGARSVEQAMHQRW